MKNPLYFLLFAAMATFISCSENEQPPEEEPSLVVGEWYIEEIIIEGTITETRDGQSEISRYSGTAISDENNKILFKEDNTYTREDFYSFMMHTFNPLAGTSSLDLHVFPYTFPVEGTYQIQGDTFTLIANPTTNITYGPLDPRDFFEGTIMELSANRIIIVEENEEISNVDGVEIAKIYETTQIFSR